MGKNSLIITGGSRSNWRFFASHLTRTDENERVTTAEIRGLAGDNVREALREMDALASGAHCKNHFYHAALNPRAGEQLTPAQWEQAVDTLERELKLDGHSRLVVEHEKDGRTHRHVIWSRLDHESMTAVPDSNNYAAHERAARELEREFGHEAVRGVHAERDGNPRPKRREKNWEVWRGQETGIDPKAVKAELTALWNECDTGQAFADALTERGYILAKGDRRDFCVIDAAGDEHSLARRIDGAKAADIRARMADLDRDALPTVAEARELARADAADDTRPPEAAPEPPAPELPAIEAEPEAPRETTPGAETAFPPAPSPGEALDAFARLWLESTRTEDGEPTAKDADGLTWWERGAVIVADIADEVTEWAKDHWQSFTERLQSERARAPKEPDIDMER